MDDRKRERDSERLPKREDGKRSQDGVDILCESDALLRFGTEKDEITMA